MPEGHFISRPTKLPFDERAIERVGGTRKDNLVCVQLAAGGRMTEGSRKIP